MKKTVILFIVMLGLSPAIWPMDKGILFVDVLGGLGYGNGFVYSYGGNVGWIITDLFFMESGYRQIGSDNNRQNVFNFGIGMQIPEPKFFDEFGIAEFRAVIWPNVLYTDKGEWGVSSKIMQVDRFFYRNNTGFKIGGGLEYALIFDPFWWAMTFFFDVGFIFYPNRMNKIAAYKRQQEERRQEEEAERIRMAELYSNVLKSSGIVQLVSYIKDYGGSQYFQSDSYIEIARRLTNNNKIDLLTIPSGYEADIPNPYSFDDKVIYFCESFTVQQWVDTSFLADVSYYGRGGNSYIYIRNVYNIKNIGKTVTNAYLQYVGAKTYQAVNGAHTVVPMFDLLYSF
jgi:hypothetical protein